MAVVISAVQVNPGRTSRTWSSSVTTTLKLVAVRAARRLRAGRLNRAVADLGHATLERAIVDGVDRDLGDLSDLDERDVRFVYFDLRLDHRHVGDGQQHGAGIVHRADDDVLADLDVAPGHDAVEGRLEPRLRQRVSACWSDPPAVDEVAPRES